LNLDETFTCHVATSSWFYL